MLAKGSAEAAEADAATGAVGFFEGAAGAPKGSVIPLLNAGPGAVCAGAAGAGKAAA